MCQSILSSKHRSVRNLLFFFLFLHLIRLSARDSYHLDGFVISDCGAVQCIMTLQNYTKTVEETVAVAMHAGVDLECGQYYLKYAQAALDNKTIVESDIDQALERAFSVLVRLGYFDPPEQQPYRLLNATSVNTNDSQQLALRSAQESIVLLKNLNNALPLNIDQLKNKKIALIGPTANATVLMQGDYFGKAPYLISPLLAFKTIVTGIMEHYRTLHSDKNYSNLKVNRSI
jgi:beta-glucosidase-like glycosyl hydrolase